jgi:uncharacterized protein (TIRG00374 family)
MPAPASSLLRKTFRILSLLLGLVLLWGAIRILDLDALLNSLRQAAPAWLALTLLSVLGSLILKAARWHALIKPVFPATTFYETFGMLMLGQAGNIILPSRSGDVLRTVYAASPDQAQIPAVATGIMVEKGIDALFLAFSAAVVLPWLPVSQVGGQPWKASLTVGVLGVLLTTLVLLTSASFWRRMRTVLTRRTHPLAAWVVTQGDRLVLGVERLRKGGRFGAFLLLTIAIWMNMIVTNLLLAGAMGITMDLRVGVLVLVLAYLAVIPGLMPGHFGPFYFLVGVGLTSLSIAAPAAAAYAVLLHLFVMSPPVILAGVYLLLRRQGRMRLQKGSQG